MEISKLRRWVGAGVIVGAVAVGGDIGFAQQPDVPPAEPGGQPATGATPEPEAPVGQPVAKRAEIAPADMSRKAAEYLTEMRDILQRAVKLQGVARAQKDIIKLNCVNEKLLQIKQLLNIGESNKTNLDEAIAREDESGRYDYFSNLTVAHDQVQTLGAEAEQCIGEDLSFMGPTETTVEGGNEPDDPTQGVEPSFPSAEPVPTSSPFI